MKDGKEMKKNIYGIFILLIGSLTAFGPLTIFKVCAVQDKVIMKCHWTAMAELGIGCVVAVLALTIMFSKSHELSRGIYFSLLPIGLYIMAVPTFLIGVCGSRMMHCNMLTRPILIVLGLVLIGLSGLGLFFKKKG